MRALVASLAGLMCLIGALPVGCAASIDVGNDSVDAASGPILPQSKDAAIEAAPVVPDAGCAATSCPAPYTTCPASDYPCDVNLMSDNANCGGCGIACPGGPDVDKVFHAAWLCNSGTCAISCDSGFADINQDPRDGCEVNTLCDPANCGGAGNACAPGVTCIQGICGCAPGFTICGTPRCGLTASVLCLDLSRSDGHCGSCDNDCGNIVPDPPLAPNMAMGCQSSACKPTCAEPFGNCNGTLDDGCEKDLSYDNANCGKCGNVCGPSQACASGTCICTEWKLGTGACTCKPGESLCNVAGVDVCRNLDSDPINCGGCNVPCGSSEVCRYGRCQRECPVGYADCNGTSNDGCEVRVDSDPYNCGGCGIACDVVAGQPCVRGQCALVPCSEQVPR